jgi:thiamine kinase
MRDGATAFGIEEASAFLAANGFGDLVSISMLRGGYWNQVMKVTCAEGKFVLKRYVEVLPNSLFPNLPEAEAAALERLSGFGVAPEQLGFWPEEKILIYRYVDGELWSGDMEAVATLLLRKEQADPAGFRSVPWQPEGILAQGDGLLVRCADDELSRRLRRARPRPFEIAPPARLSLIHTDIGAGNLVGTGNGLRLIDWQCPAEGDLAEDVYSFLSPAFQILNNCVPVRETDGFFEALAMPDVRTRYLTLRTYFAYRMAAYCCLRYQGAGDDEALYDRYHAATEAELDHVEQRS